METTYRLNADELDNRFIESLKSVFKNKEIEITVTEIDDTEYLFRSQANREHLLSAIDDVENNRNVIIPDQKLFQWEKLRFINKLLMIIQMNKTILKFLADVNIESGIISGLRTDGHDVVWMLEKNKYLTDEKILNMAREEKRIMITNDKDFGEIVYRLKLISNGIVLFRVKDQNENVKLKLIRKAIDYKNENLSRYFTVLTEAKIRFIKLEE